MCLTVKKAKVILGFTRNSVASRLRQGLLLLCPGELASGGLCPVLDFPVQLPGQLLERVQQRVLKMTKRLGYHFYRGKLRDLQLFSLGKRRQGGDLINACKYQKGGDQEAGAGIFSVMPSGKTKGN